MRLGEKARLQVPAISTGSLKLDLATGVGGFPRGRVTELYGPESSGKTTLALHVVARAQARGSPRRQAARSRPPGGAARPRGEEAQANGGRGGGRCGRRAARVGRLRRVGQRELERWRRRVEHARAAGLGLVLGGAPRLSSRRLQAYM